jgi:hypothetical protein
MMHNVIERIHKHVLICSSGGGILSVLDKGIANKAHYLGTPGPVREA